MLSFFPIFMLYNLPVCFDRNFRNQTHLLKVDVSNIDAWLVNWKLNWTAVWCGYIANLKVKNSR